jgi:hypothetical protein
MISIFLRCPTVLARRNPTAGNGIFGCRDRRLKSDGETASVTGDRKSGPIPAKIPTETAHFDSGWKSAVWKDWMVEMIWTELAAPHPVLSNRVSATRKTVEKANFDKDKTKNHRANRKRLPGALSTGTLWA